MVGGSVTGDREQRWFHLDPTCASVFGELLKGRGMKMASVTGSHLFLPP